jgi:hypothetical protein
MVDTWMSYRTMELAMNQVSGDQLLNVLLTLILGKQVAELS